MEKGGREIEKAREERKKKGRAREWEGGPEGGRQGGKKEGKTGEEGGEMDGWRERAEGKEGGRERKGGAGDGTKSWRER